MVIVLQSLPVFVVVVIVIYSVVVFYFYLVSTLVVVGVDLVVIDALVVIERSYRSCWSCC